MSLRQHAKRRCRREHQLHFQYDGDSWKGEMAMKEAKSFAVHTLWISVGLTLCLICLGVPAGAQTLIPEGTTINVRTDNAIVSNVSNGRVYHGVVDQAVYGRNGDLVIPQGSDAELIVRRVSDNDLVLDLDSVMVNGERYGVEASSGAISSGDNDGIGANKRTGKFVGGGAILGAIVGGIAGGGKGAALGAGAGAAAGAGAQVLTRGGRIDVPPESLLTFQLKEPLQAGVSDDGFEREGNHYHRGYSNGYDEGYRAKPGSYYSGSPWSINIGPDQNITWQAPDSANVYVQVDGQAPKLFASGQNGTQKAPWMTKGHLYVFILQDQNGNEIARSEQDLR